MEMDLQVQGINLSSFEVHGGQIVVQSELGVGTVFTAILLLHNAND